MRFRRALDRGNVTEALSAANELQFVGLAEALELTLLLADGEDARYERAALRWHARFVYETKNVDIRESVAVLALLTAIPANRLAASALAELFSRRRSLERCAEALVRGSRAPLETNSGLEARALSLFSGDESPRDALGAGRAD
jgi:hypothetical protein